MNLSTDYTDNLVTPKDLRAIMFSEKEILRTKNILLVFTFSLLQIRNSNTFKNIEKYVSNCFNMSHYNILIYYIKCYNYQDSFHYTSVGLILMLEEKQ